eukprot:jgi/Mesvir1/146/Mv13511-RA.3
MFDTEKEWLDALATDATLRRVMARQLPSFAGKHLSRQGQIKLDGCVAAAAARQTNGDVDLLELECALGEDDFGTVRLLAFHDKVFKDAVCQAYSAAGGPQAAGTAGSCGKRANTSSQGPGSPTHGVTHNNKRTRFAGSGGGCGPDGNASRAHGSNPTGNPVSSPAQPALASPGTANSPSAKLTLLRLLLASSAQAAPAGNAGRSPAATPVAATPVQNPAAPRDEACIRAAPTQRPSLNASAPPMWWGDDSKRPHTWITTAPPLRPNRVPLDRKSKEYQHLSEQVKKFGLEVTAVTRVQNPKLWEQYHQERLRMLESKVPKRGQDIRPEFPRYNLHESLLYHCSSDAVHAKIYEEGLDVTLPIHLRLFGAGIYLTDDPRRVEQHTSATGKLYVCAAILGDVLAVLARRDDAPWTTEPEKTAIDRRTPADTHFNSLVGRRANDSSGTTGANEFVLYKQDAVCPMYVVEFARASARLSSATPSAYGGVPNFVWKSKGTRGAIVPNPFGTVAGSSNYVDNGHSWNNFLYTFYGAVIPDSNLELCRIPLGQPVPAGHTRPTSSSQPAIPVFCVGRVVTQLLLAQKPGLTCLICHASLQPTGNDTACLVLPCGHINGHVRCWQSRIQTNRFTKCKVCSKCYGVPSGPPPASTQATPPAQTAPKASTRVPPAATTPAAQVGNAGRSPAPVRAAATPAPVRTIAQPAAPTPAAATPVKTTAQPAAPAPAAAIIVGVRTPPGGPTPAAAAITGNAGKAGAPALAAVTTVRTAATPAPPAASPSPGSDPKDQNYVSAAPTERPPSTASRPPAWWWDDSNRPHMWTTVDSSLPFECISLAKNSTEHQYWSGRMEMFGLDVTAVTRIQNPRLWEKYVMERRHMLQDKVGKEGQGGKTNLPLFSFHESLLYHCSKEPDHTKICRQGLDLRRAGRGTFGAGIYLTDDPRKAMVYSNNTGKIYVCAALLGDVLAVPARTYSDAAPWRMEPEKAIEDQRTLTDKHFDSLVGRRADGSSTGANEFVLYKPFATCPMYMVEYAKTSSKQGKGIPPTLDAVPDFAWKSKGAPGANVQNPFGIVAGTNHLESCNNFLHSFYHAVLPAFSKPLMRKPIGTNVLANAPNAANPTNPRTVCTGFLVTEDILAQHSGCKCIMCQSALVKGETCLVMPCGHINGHASCCVPRIQTRVMADGVTSQTFTRCERCMQRFGVTVGMQPLSATMTHQLDRGLTLAGSAQGAIKITYHVPDGRQDCDGQYPGKPFEGTFRTAYLPDSSEGHDVLKWLQQAFQQRLIFSVGTSLTTGKDNVVTWAGIHHKTDLTPNAEHGYPDDTYLKRVKEEMQQAGVILL